MPAWAWVLCVLLAFTGLAALFLALFRVRYRLEWRGRWDGGASGSSRGTIRLEYGFPGFMREWDPGRKWSLADLLVDDDNDDEAENAGEEISGGRKSGASSHASPGFSERAEPAREEPLFLKSGPRPGRPAAAERRDEDSRRGPPKNDNNHNSSPDRNRRRRALFRFATDRDAWRFLARYGVRTLKLLFGLLRPRFEAAVGDPDPARLGRLAGGWHAVRPLLPVGDSTLRFRFQDRHPSLWVKAEGGFSALAALAFGIRLLWAFPLLRLGYRALYGWRHHRLTGWRAWAYRRLQTRA